jgi:hypothetical protein
LEAGPRDSGGDYARNHLYRGTDRSTFGHPLVLRLALRTFNMAEIVERTAVPSPVKYVQWGPVIAGAVTAAALAAVLHSFAAAIGLSVSSTAPTWRDASVGLWILSGVYLILVALAAYGLGGYIAGLLRDPIATNARTDEIELRDNVHGLLVWAVATLITALLLVLAASASTKLAAPSGGGA